MSGGRMSDRGFIRNTIFRKDRQSGEPSGEDSHVQSALSALYDDANVPAYQCVLIETLLREQREQRTLLQRILEKLDGSGNERPHEQQTQRPDSSAEKERHGRNEFGKQTPSLSSFPSTSATSSSSGMRHVASPVAPEEPEPSLFASVKEENGIDQLLQRTNSQWERGDEPSTSQQSLPDNDLDGINDLFVGDASETFRQLTGIINSAAGVSHRVEPVFPRSSDIPLSPQLEATLPAKRKGGRKRVPEGEEATAAVVDAKKGYVCQICSQHVRTITRLREHLASHAGVRNFICPNCGKRFVRRDNLTTHYKRCHKDPTVPTYDAGNTMVMGMSAMGEMVEAGESRRKLRSSEDDEEMD